MKLDLIYALINSLGLIFDIIGATGIYLYKIQSIQAIKRTPVPRVNETYKIEPNLNGIIADINKNIEEVNNRNEIADRKAKPFFVMIFVGFMLQIVSVWISFFSN